MGTEPRRLSPQEMLVVPQINTSSPSWQEVVRTLRNQREALYIELAALPGEGRYDSTDFIRGRIHELTQLIDLK